MLNKQDLRVTIKAGSFAVVSAKGQISPQLSTLDELADWLQAKGLSLFAGFKIIKEDA